MRREKIVSKKRRQHGGTLDQPRGCRQERVAGDVHVSAARRRDWVSTHRPGSAATHRPARRRGAKTGNCPSQTGSARSRRRPSRAADSPFAIDRRPTARHCCLANRARRFGCLPDAGASASRREAAVRDPETFQRSAPGRPEVLPDPRRSPRCRRRRGPRRPHAAGPGTVARPPGRRRGVGVRERGRRQCVELRTPQPWLRQPRAAGIDEIDVAVGAEHPAENENRPGFIAAALGPPGTRRSDRAAIPRRRSGDRHGDANLLRAEAPVWFRRFSELRGNRSPP